jgi:hypothetical protein
MIGMSLKGNKTNLGGFVISETPMKRAVSMHLRRTKLS